MQIYGPYRVSQSQLTGTQGVGPTNRGASSQPAGVKPSAAPVDQLDLSASASVNRMQEASPIAGNGEIRLDRVAQIRREIADGSYETPEKLDAALDRLLDQFG